MSTGSPAKTVELGDELAGEEDKEEKKRNKEEKEGDHERKKKNKKEEEQKDEVKDGNEGDGTIHTPREEDGQGDGSTSENGKVRYVKTPSSAVVDNPASDMRNMRRIIAEDQQWSLATVSTLVEICIKHIVDNFENNPNPLKKLLPKHKFKVLEKLSVELPLKITANLIEEASYWKRCCQLRWTVCNVANYGDSWKQMYFERNLQHIIEFFVPEKTDSTELKETLLVSSGFIKKLDFGQLLPPVIDLTKPAEYLEDGSDAASELEPECDHFNLCPVLKQLSLLEELHLTYSVRDCGMNFGWSMFQFTKKDCQRLCEAIQSCQTLRVLHLHRSKVDDERVRVLMHHLIDHPRLEVLDLSHNCIKDRGAKAIGKLITSSDRILKLNLCNNMIGAIGGQALAHALVKTTKLKLLNLRLNRIGDEGGQNLCKALTRNSSLEELNLAANDMGETTAAALAQVLLTNTTLTIIDFSCNNVGQEGGKQIVDGMEENTAVTHLDLRLTDCGQEAEFHINQILDRNQEIKRENLLNLKKSETVNAKV